MVGSERQGRRHGPLRPVLGLRFANLFWALVTPWWSFLFDGPASTSNALLAAAIVVGATLVPSIRLSRRCAHRCPRAAVVATLEPVLAAVFAWLIHDEALAAVQIAGGMAVIAAVAWGSHDARPRGRDGPELAGSGISAPSSAGQAARAVVAIRMPRRLEPLHRRDVLRVRWLAVFACLLGAFAWA